MFNFSREVHCLRTHKFNFLTTFSLKMSLTVLFTHLKIILLQYFQFLVFSYIETDPMYSNYVLRYKIINNHKLCLEYIQLLLSYTCVYIINETVLCFVTLFFSSCCKRQASNFSVMNSNSCMHGCMSRCKLSFYFI